MQSCSRAPRNSGSSRLRPSSSTVSTIRGTCRLTLCRPSSTASSDPSAFNSDGRRRQPWPVFCLRSVGFAMPHADVSPEVRGNARRMRNAMTEAEPSSGNELRGGSVMWLGFRRQVPIAGYRQAEGGMRRRPPQRVRHEIHPPAPARLQVLCRTDGIRHRSAA